MSKKEKITVQGTEITVIVSRSEDYISLTDMANAKEGQARAADIIKNWIRTRTTLEFLGTWEQLYNPDFKVVEFDHFKMQAGLPSFVLSPGQWTEKTNAIEIFPNRDVTAEVHLHTQMRSLVDSRKLCHLL
jgi:hypothetical protein